MQTDIINKAERLGLDIGDGSSSNENLHLIAEQMGINDFVGTKDDLNSLDAALTNEMNNNLLNRAKNIGLDISDRINISIQRKSD